MLGKSVRNTVCPNVTNGCLHILQRLMRMVEGLMVIGEYMLR